MMCISTSWITIPLACLAFGTIGTIALISTTSDERPQSTQSVHDSRDAHDSRGEGPSHSVPELNPGSLGSALTLLGLGTAMLVDRRRPKRTTPAEEHTP